MGSWSYDEVYSDTLKGNFMSSYCFYSQDALALAQSSGVDVLINNYADQYKKQTYILCRPLSNEDVKYDYDQAIAVFSSGIKPFFIDIGNDSELFEEYQEDFLEDVSFLAEKFKYREKNWQKKNHGRACSIHFL